MSADIRTDDIAAGYRAFNGYVFTAHDAKRYNEQNREVERNTRHCRGLERALAARHKTFWMITEQGAQS